MGDDDDDNVGRQTDYFCSRHQGLIFAFAVLNSDDAKLPETRPTRGIH